MVCLYTGLIIRPYSVILTLLKMGCHSTPPLPYGELSYTCLVSLNTHYKALHCRVFCYTKGVSGMHQLGVY